MLSARPLPSALLALAAAAALASCGGGGGRDDTPHRAANQTRFPPARGMTVAALRRRLMPGPILAATVSDLTPGVNRFGFGLFDSRHRQVQDAEVALYVERSGTGRLTGPFRARQLSLAVAGPFESETVAQDPDAAKSLYVTSLPFQSAGAYAVEALVKIDGHVVASQPTAVEVAPHDEIPRVGQRAPRVDTPTLASVHGDAYDIDTRRPPDSMHAVNLADVLGRRPVMLLFATPALCQSRVCGPVTDIAEEVAHAHRGEAAFIHNEIYIDNEILPGCLEGTRPASECFRPQVLAYRLPTEPWLFAIDRHGIIAARLEGAFSKSELEAALAAALRR